MDHWLPIFLKQRWDQDFLISLYLNTPQSTFTLGSFGEPLRFLGTYFSYGNQEIPRLTYPSDDRGPGIQLGPGPSSTFKVWDYLKVNDYLRKSEPPIPLPDEMIINFKPFKF